jgi:FixJ family two-component response regulator
VLQSGRLFASLRRHYFTDEGSHLKTNLIVSIVDDDESVRTATSSLLRSLGWQVCLYASAEAFLESGTASDVTCVISDIQMPGMTGIEMQQRLLRSGHAPPIIFITAFESEVARKQALESGALCFLNKPVDGAAISQCLQKLVQDSENGH